MMSAMSIIADIVLLLRPEKNEMRYCIRNLKILYFCNTVKKIIASILLFAFWGQTFNQGWYCIGYLVQQKEYMKQCVNRYRPQLHCDGKCLLMKKIEAQEKKENGQAPEMKYAGKTEVLSSKSFFVQSLSMPVITDACYRIASDAGSPVDQPSSVFHPPTVAA